MRLSGIRFKDFFGIANVTTKTISGISSQTKLVQEKVASKYEPLTIARKKLESEETLVINNFGSIRFDCDNVVRKHGHFDSTNQDLLYDTVTIKDKFTQHNEGKERVPGQDIQDEDGKPMDSTNRSLEEIMELFKKPKAKLSFQNKPPLTFEFEPDREELAKPIVTKLSGRAENIILSDKDVTLANQLVNSAQKDILARDDDVDEPEDWNQNYEMEPEIPVIEKRKKPVNAYDYVKDNIIENDRTRSKIKLDSKGFNDYSDQVVDWHKIRRTDAINILRSSIIYDNYDIIAINKPYGIASHEENRKVEPFDVNSLMQEIGQQLGSEKLYLAHRLDKLTTGVLLFARTPERAKKLNKLFKGDLIKKIYWCITVGVPDPNEAIIDIPIGEFTVAHKVRSCLVPEHWPAEKQIATRYREARRATTEYKVLNSQKYWSLVEVKPQSGVKHQIRCHLSYGLRTPILGDHKYAHLLKVAPQKIPAQMLNKLNVRKQKVRTIPMHLHARSIVVPDVKLDRSTLFINAPLPHHFSDNLKRLNLKLKE